MRELTEHDKQLIIGSIPDDSLMFFAPGLQGHGGKLIDRSPFANHGTINGATWVRLPTGPLVLQFDGSDDEIVCTSPFGDVDLWRTAFSVITWSYHEPNINWPFQLLILPTSEANCAFALYMSQDYYPMVGFRTMGQTHIAGLHDDSRIYHTHKWEMTGFTTDGSGTWTGDHYKLYRDGVYVPFEDGGSDDALRSQDAGKLIIGRGQGSPNPNYYFKGMIGLIVLTSNVLSVDKMLRAYTRQRLLLGV